VSSRARQFSLCLAALAAGAGMGLALPELTPSDAAAPATASIEAYDFGWRDPSTQDSTANVAVGGTVTFSYPSGMSSHNVVFSERQPATCTQTAGPGSAPWPPLPPTPTGDGWAGTCRFDAPGTYAFHCGLHATMTGSIVVGDAPSGTNTGTTGTGTTGTTTGPGHPPKPPRIKVPKRQRGAVVHGSVTTPAGPSRISVRAFVSSGMLEQPEAGAARRVRVGSFSKRSTGTGRTPFAVRLRAKARRALKRRGRLAVALKIVVTPEGGKPVTKAAAVTLRPRG
jgi:plastocyanin